MHLGDRQVEDGLVPAVDRLGRRDRHQRPGPLGIAAASSEQRFGTRHPKHTDREVLGVLGVAGEQRGGLVPAALPDQPLGGQRVRVAAVARIEPREPGLGDGFERDGDALLAAPGIEQCDAVVEGRECSSERGGRRAPRFAARDHAALGITEAAVYDALDASGHHP